MTKKRRDRRDYWISDWDDFVFVSPEELPPSAVPNLVRRLGLDDAPEAEQRAGIVNWFANVPSKEALAIFAAYGISLPPTSDAR